VSCHTGISERNVGRGEFPSSVITRATFSPSLSRLKRGNGVRLRLLCTFPKDVNVTPKRALSDSPASHGVVSRYGECADSGDDVDSIMWSGEDHVEEEDHVWGRSHMFFMPPSARMEQSASCWVCAEAESG
jgi:hypothetical protein